MTVSDYGWESDQCESDYGWESDRCESDYE